MTSEQAVGPDEARRRLLAERDRLRGLHGDLEAGLSSVTEAESLGELSDADQHSADVGTETFNRERDVSLVASIEAELDDVEAALKRLEEGRYGVCTACGRPISAERLEVMPATPYCLEDAERASVEARRQG